MRKMITAAANQLTHMHGHQNRLASLNGLMPKYKICHKHSLFPLFYCAQLKPLQTLRPNRFHKVIDDDLGLINDHSVNRDL